MPFNRIATTSPDSISLVPRGIIAIKRPGIYLFTGSATPYGFTSWCQLSISKNRWILTQLRHFNTKAESSIETESITFSYTLNITKTDLLANPTLACNVEVQLGCGVNQTLKWDSPTNWVHVTKLNWNDVN